MKHFLSLFLLALSTSSFANTQLPNNPHIAVVGSAQMMAMPDIAMIHLNVESVKKSSLDAKRDVDQRVNNLLEGLVKFSIDEKNVSASNISTEPRYSYGRNEREKIEGYVARRTLKVTLTEIDKLNEFMDFALSVKINAIRNIELKSSKAEALKQEALMMAIKNAKAKADELAKGFDAKRGKIYSINSSSEHYAHRFGANERAQRYEMSAMADGQAKAGRYLQENIVFNAAVNVVFNLNP